MRINSSMNGIKDMYRRNILHSRPKHVEKSYLKLCAGSVEITNTWSLTLASCHTEKATNKVRKVSVAALLLVLAGFSTCYLGTVRFTITHSNPAYSPARPNSTMLLSCQRRLSHPQRPILMIPDQLYSEASVRGVRIRRRRRSRRLPCS